MLIHLEGGHNIVTKAKSLLDLALPYDCECLERIPPPLLLVVSKSLELVNAVNGCVGTIGGGF